MTTATVSTKDAVIEMIRRMPDDVDLEDIQYALYVRQKIERGLQQADAGLTVPHDEVVKRLSRWLDGPGGEREGESHE